MANIFEDLTKLKPAEITDNSQLALEWFRTNIRRIFDRRQNEKVYIDGTRTGTIVEGNMYMMFYKAKHVNTLPWYDRFPLVIPYDVRSVQDGFYGINLHYIPPMARQNLLEEMYKYPSETGIDLEFRHFTSIKRLNSAIPCVKRYLYSRIIRKPLEIEKVYWDVAAMLPTADFVSSKGKINTNTVYSKSRKQI